MSNQSTARGWISTLVAVIALIWAGMVLGVSVLATPVKFQAEGLTLPVALDVGRITFQAFNLVELVLGGGLLVLAVLGRMSKVYGLLAAAAMAIVIAQWAYLLPALSERTDIVMAGGTLPSASYHAWYVLAESSKIILLLVIGVSASRSGAH